MPDPRRRDDRTDPDQRTPAQRGGEISLRQPNERPAPPPPPKHDIPPHILQMLMELQGKVGKLEGMIEVMLRERGAK